MLEQRLQRHSFATRKNQAFGNTTVTNLHLAKLHFGFVEIINILLK